jgi:hypothetical protein
MYKIKEIKRISEYVLKNDFDFDYKEYNMFCVTNVYKIQDAAGRLFFIQFVYNNTLYILDAENILYTEHRKNKAYPISFYEYCTEEIIVTNFVVTEDREIFETDGVARKFFNKKLYGGRRAVWFGEEKEAQTSAHDLNVATRDCINIRFKFLDLKDIGD